MDRPIENTLKALTKTSSGPFRAIAYGVPDDSDRNIERELRRLLKERKLLDHDPVIVVEPKPTDEPAVERLHFKNQVLARLRPPKKKGRGGDRLVGPGAIERAREELVEINAQVPGALADIDRKLERITHQQPIESEEAPESDLKEPVKLQEDPIWILVVRRYEDLGANGGAVASALLKTVQKGAHILITEGDLDTRRREGRMVAQAVIHVGQIRKDKASAKAQ